MKLLRMFSALVLLITLSIPFVTKAQTPVVSTFYDGLVNAQGLVFDNNGNLYVSVVNSIVKITPLGVQSTYATGFASAENMVFDSNGNMFVADIFENTIFKVDSAGQSTFFASLLSPADIAIDGFDNLYVVGSTDMNVSKITPAGVISTVATLTGTKLSGIICDNYSIYVTEAESGGQVYRIKFSGSVNNFSLISSGALNGISLGPDGNFYIAGSSDNKIYKVTSAGVNSVYCGTGNAASVNGDLQTAQFSNPYKTTFSPSGDLYISDKTSGMIRKISNIIQPVSSVMVTSPNGQESWNANTAQNITWTSSGVTTLNLYYSTNSGANWYMIADGVQAAAGTYSWTVPDSASTNCLIKIEDGTNLTLSDVSDFRFSITAPVPVITLVSPNTAVLGQTLSVSLSGQYTHFNQGTATIWFAQGTNTITAGSYTASSATQLSANFTIPSNAVTGSYSVNVQNSTDSLVILTNGFTINQSANITAGLIAYYPFNGNANDESGFNNHGVSSGATLTADKDGTANSAYNFDGTSNKITVANGLQGLTNKLTVSFWVYKDATWDAVNAGERMLGCGNSFRFYKTTSAYKINFGTTTSSTVIAKSANYPTGAAWHHFVGVYDSSNVKLYIDGVLIDTQTQSGNFQNLVPLTFGVYGSVQYFKGKMDEIRIYNRALSDVEVQTLFSGAAANPAVAVTSPNGGEQWTVNATQNITWTSSNVAAIKLDYSSDNGTSWSPITASTSALTGQYAWTTPSTISSQYLVKISDVLTSVSDISDSVFSILQNRDTLVSTFATGLVNAEGIKFDAHDNLYVAQTSQIIKITPEGQQTVFATGFSDAAGMVFDNNGNLFCADYGGSAVYKIDPNGTKTFFADGVESPIDLAFDHSGNLFALEYYSSIIKKIDANGIPTTFASLGAQRGSGLSIDNNDNLFASGGNTNIVYKITPAGLVSSFSSPSGMSWAGSSCFGLGQKLYVTSQDAHRIFELDKNGNYRVFLGDGTAATTNGLLSVAQTSTPVSISVDSKGSIYFNEFYTGNVRKVTIPRNDTSIVVVSPNGGEVWATGSNHIINWTSNNISNVKIQYSIDNGQLWNTIVASYPADSNTYNWTIPNSSSQECLVKITNTADTTRFDVSDTLFTIAKPIVNITSPNGGEVWAAGTSQNITWTSTNLTLVKLEYTIDNGTNWSTIATNVNAAAGSYSWTVPTNQSNLCMIRISDVYNANFKDSSDAVFSITGPSIVITSPNGGENWVGGSQHYIYWTSNTISQYVNLDYSINGGASWTAISGGLPNSGYANWTVPNTPSTQCKIRISDYYTAAYYDVSDNNFTITAATGTITLNTPNGGENWTVGSSQTISWSSTFVDNVKIEYSTNGGYTWDLVVASTPAANTAYTWTIPATPSNNCKIKISDVSNIAVFDESYTVFSLLDAYVEVVTPNGGETYNGGSSMNIYWNSTGLSSYVLLEYTTDNGSTWNTIVNGESNSGLYNWSVPNVATSSTCRVKITDYYDSFLSDESNANFTIVKTPSTITISYPNGNENLITNTSQYISWTSQYLTTVNILFSSNNGSSWDTVATNYPSSNSSSYTWVTPSTASTNCLVKVIDVNDMGVYDVSNMPFTLSNPSLTLTSPNGAEIYTGGSSSYVYWQYNGIQTSYLKLEYSINNGSSWNLITNSAYVGSNYYSWTIPNTPSTQCLFRITDTNTGIYSDVSDANFTIVGVPASISLSTPNGNENWLVGSQQYIYWSATNCPVVKLDYTTDNGSSWQPIVSGASGSTGYYIWTIPNTPSSNCRVRVSDSADAATYDISNSVFRISNQYITVTNPNGGENLTGGANYAIYWSSLGAGSSVTIDYTIDNGANWTTIVSGASNNGVYNWVVPNTPSTNCKVRVSDYFTPSITDESNSRFNINASGSPTIMVYSPNAGENYTANTAYTVSWTSTSVTNVKLEYTLNDGASWNSIIASTPASQGSYTWTTPNATSNLCRVKITDVSNPLYSDISDNTFSITQPAVTLLIPNDGETWTAGYSYNITWNSIGLSSYVKIEYSLDFGTTWQTIVNGASNNGQYLWSIPTNIVTTPVYDCYIRVSDYYTNSISDMSDMSFNILPAAPSITVSTPNNGENWNVGTTQTIYWSVENVDSVKIEYTTNNGASWNTIVAKTPASANSFNWVIPATPSTQCKVKITDIANAGVSDVSNNFFTITQPYITVISPNGGEQWVANSTQTVKWIAHGSMTYVYMFYSVDSGATWTYNNYYSASAGQGTWYVPNFPSTRCLIYLNDDYYNQTTTKDTSNAVFTILPLPPSITVTAPNGGQSWSEGSTQSITWSATSVDTIDVAYTIDNGLTWTTIADNISASPTYMNWVVPVTPSTRCRIKITDSYNTSITDMSDQLFTIIHPYIYVSTPNGGESWDAGTNHSVSWLGQGYTGYASVYYSTDSGSTWNNIAVGGFGSPVNWTVPNVNSHNCLVKVVDYQNSNLGDISDAVFTINPLVPQISVASPNGGETWVVGTSQNVYWSATAVSYFNVYYSINNGTTWNTLVTNTSGNSYSWVIPDSLSSQCLIKVENADNHSLYDVSNASFSITNPSIAVTTPNGGDVWTSGTNQYITWNRVGGSSYVVIKYSINNGSTWNVISNQASNNGYYYWTVPADFSYNCLVSVVDFTYSNIGDTSNAVFTIIPPIPYLTLTSPNGYESWVVGSTHNISWSSGYISNVKLEYTRNNGLTWNTIVASTTASTGYYSWIIPDSSSAQCKVRVTDVSNPSRTDMSNYSFSITTPTLTVTTPNGGESWTVNTNNYIYWSGNGISNYVALYYSIDNGANWFLINDYTYNYGYYQWYVPNTPSQLCLVKVVDANNANTFDVSNSRFTIAPVGKSITVNSPNGYESWLIGSTQTISWTSAMVNNVKIEYSTNGGSQWNQIVASTSASAGNYTWTVPGPASSYCHVRVTDVDSAAINDRSNNYFSMYEPYLTLTSPNGGESWGMGTTQYIYWNSAGVSTVNLEYTLNNGVSWTVITSSTNAANGYYAWSVPSSPSSNCRVRVTDNDNSSRSDMSNNVFTIPAPSVTLTSPNGGETWGVATSHNIYWSAQSVSNVKLEYTTNGGTNWTTIVSSTAASSGYYQWLIPNVPSVNCKVRISEVGNAQLTDESNNVFTIVAPIITITSPNGAENWMATTTHNITWSSTAATSYVKIEYTTNGTNWNTIVANTYNSGSYSWVIPNISSQNCKIRVTDVNNATVSDMSDAAFTITVATPSITVTSPNGGESWSVGSQHNIYWTSVAINNVKIEYSINNGTSWNTVVASTAASNGYFIWTVPNTPSINCRIKVTDATNAATYDVSNASFIIPAAAITLTSPNGGESWGVATTQSISWSSTSIVNIKIEYTTDNGTSWNTITTSVSAAQSYYNWSVPNTPSALCKVRVSDASQPSVSDASNSVFSIMTPTITITSPNGGEQWTAGNLQYITWTSVGVSSYVNIDVSTNNGASWSNVATGAYNSGSYSWTLPNTPSTQCKVRVRDYYTGSVNDISNNTFTIKNAVATLALSSPNGGENYLIGNANYIYWNSTAISNVKLEYSINNGTSWNTITTSTAASNGSYFWITPNAPSTQCLVKISNVVNDSLYDISNAPFSISEPIPALTLTSPNGGETWYVGNYSYISWSSNVVNAVKIELSADNGANWSLVAASYPAANGYYYYNVPNTQSTQCLVKVTDVSNTSLFDVSNAVFTIDTVFVNSNTIAIDTLRILNCKGDTMNIDFTASGTYNNGNVFTAQLSDAAGSFSYPTPIGTLSAVTSGTIHATLPSVLTSSANYKVRVVSSDYATVGATYAHAVTISSPEFDFAADSVVRYLPNALVNFTFSGDTGSYQWTLGTGDSSVVSSPSYAYTQVGFYNVKLTIVDTKGCSASVEKLNYIDVEQIFPTIPIVPITQNSLRGVTINKHNVGFAVGTGGKVIKTIDGGTSWQDMNLNINTNFDGVCYATDPVVSETDNYVVGEQGTVLRTINDGATWTTETLGTVSNLHGVSFSDNTNGFVVGDNGTIFHYNGTNWTDVSLSGISVNLTSVHTISTTLAYAVGTNGVIVKWNGTTWTPLTTGLSIPLKGVNFYDANVGYAVGANGTVIKTIDGGLSWNTVFSGIASDFMNVVVNGPDTAWVIGNDGIVYQTLNGGYPFERFSIGNKGNLFGISFTAGLGSIVGVNGGVFQFGKPTIAVGSLTDTVYCPGADIIVPFNAIGGFQPGNNFTAELSDAFGNFGSPSVIGVLAGTAGGTIHGTIPVMTSSGNGYKIRIISSDTAIIGNISNYTITVLAAPVVDLGADQTLCEGSSVLLDAGNAGSQFAWSTTDNTQTITATTSGTYAVTVYGASGCNRSDDVVITLFQPPVVFLGADTTLCSGSALTLNAHNQGSSYSWSTGASSQTISVTTSGDYAVTVSNAQNCSAIDSIHAVFNPSPVVNLGADTTICEGATVTINAGNAGFEFNWSTTATTQTITIANTGNYIVTVTNPITGCATIDAKYVNVVPLPVVNLGADLNICAGSTTTLNAGNPGDYYIWSTGATTQTITVSTAGEYFVTVSNYSSCAVSDSVVVTILPAPNVVLANDTAICNGGSVVLNAGNTGSTYFWSTGATTQSITATTSNTYIVTVTASNGCKDTDAMILTVYNNPVVNLGKDTVVCNGTSLTINALNSGSTYHWNTGAATQSITITAAGNYSVTVTNANGCTDRDTIVVGYQVCTDCATCTDAFFYTASGNLRLGNDTMQYCNYASCTWAINAPNDSARTIIDFSMFDIKYGDKLSIYKGIGANAVLVGAYDNGSMPTQVVVYSDSVYLQFISNATITGEGFKAAYYTVTTGILEANSVTLDAGIYPNPNKGSFNLEMTSNNSEKVSIKIMNLLGVEVYSEELIKDAGDYVKPMDLTGLADGVYYITLSNEKQKLVKRLVIEK